MCGLWSILAWRAASAVQLVRGLRNLAALVACSDQLVRARHARAITTGNCRGTVRRPTRNLVKGHLTRMAVVEADDHHAEYNLEQAPARIFQIWVTPASPGCSPAWGAQPCPMADRSGCFVAIASGFDSDHDALPIRASARVLNAKLKVGESIEYVLREKRLAYLVPSSGTVDVNGVRIHARDGAAIKDVDIVAITAIEDADVVMVDVL